MKNDCARQSLPAGINNSAVEYNMYCNDRWCFGIAKATAAANLGGN